MRTASLAVTLLVIGSGLAAQEPVPGRDPVQLRDAWARAQPSASGQSAFYGLLVNGSDRDVTITRVVCERVRRPEIHESVVRDDIVTMRRVTELRIPRGKSVELRPGGIHLMLMALEAPLALGDTVTCTFLGGDTVLARGSGTVRAP